MFAGIRVTSHSLVTSAENLLQTSHASKNTRGCIRVTDQILKKKTYYNKLTVKKLVACITYQVKKGFGRLE